MFAWRVRVGASHALDKRMLRVVSEAQPSCPRPSNTNNAMLASQPAFGKGPLDSCRTHTPHENRKQEQSKKSGERKLLRSCRAALQAHNTALCGNQMEHAPSGAALGQGKRLRTALHRGLLTVHQQASYYPMSARR